MRFSTDNLEGLEVISFDQVKVIEGDRAGKFYAPEEFIEVPVIERVKLIVSKSVIFLKHGVEVNRLQALNELRQLAARK